MSLVDSRKAELEALARQMLASNLGAAQYESFGTLVKRETPEFNQRQAAGTIALGDLQVDDSGFVLFAN